MMKICSLALCLMGLTFFAKAQSRNPFRLSDKDLLKPFKADTSLFGLKQLPTPNSLRALQTLPQLNLTPQGFKSNMPIAKLSSADRMPVLNLADTKTTHYTMLIAPIEGERAARK